METILLSINLSITLVIIILMISGIKNIKKYNIYKKK